MASKLGTQQNEQEFFDLTLFRKLAGSLQYLSNTRPNIAFATNSICQRMHHPRNCDFHALKRLLRYIKGTLNFGLPITHGNLQLRTYTDADWAADPTDRKSTTGYCTFLGLNLISWSVKKQSTVVKSSTEAEYMSLSSSTSDILWLHRLVAEFHTQTNPTAIFCDNTSAIVLANNPPPLQLYNHHSVSHHALCL
ncbi:uncharacterized protein LOC110103535 [Dendrobium catenatum]|uniref:uncharacterized protein LOC110103535 n=1 Tax=Dendrobium catenatum TaxID=906689 RepID=UPI0009F5E9E1|nr:uncharacterized protein LOC110103535 [Dendrobium catenatum]